MSNEEINKRLLDTLQKIANWETPSTGEFWDKEKTQPISYEANYGSNGVRKYFRNMAKNAIKKYSVIPVDASIQPELLSTSLNDHLNGQQ